MTEGGDASATWMVEASSRFQRDLARLPAHVAAAVVEFVTATLPDNPERMSKPLVGDLNGLRSARRGDYRVLFELDHNRSVILLIRVGHRAHIYRPR